jgi:3-hydroxyacyl-CoA dehydrogenase
MGTPECARCATLFFAERAASKIPDVPDDTPTRKIAKVA